MKHKPLYSTTKPFDEFISWIDIHREIMNNTCPSTSEDHSMSYVSIDKNNIKCYDVDRFLRYIIFIVYSRL